MSRQTERWSEMRELERDRAALLEDMVSEWQPNDNGERLAPEFISDLGVEKVHNLLGPEYGWEEYLTEKGAEMMARLCNIDTELEHLENVDYDEDVAAAANQYYHH